MSSFETRLEEIEKRLGKETKVCPYCEGPEHDGICEAAEIAFRELLKPS